MAAAAQSVSGALDRLAWQHCIPLTVTLEMTLQCQLRCFHCYNMERRGTGASALRPAGAAAAVLTLAEMQRFIDEVAAAGCLFLVLTGGEPLLHPDLLATVAAARRRHLAVTLKSNGVGMDAGRAAALARAGVGAVHVSLYGAEAATHDGVTGVAGSWAGAVAGIGHCVAAGLATTVSFGLLRGNAAQTGAVLALAQQWGCAVVVDSHLTARVMGDGAAHAAVLARHAVERATLRELYNSVLRAHLPAPDFSLSRSVQCGCARTVCALSARGELYPCIGAPLMAGDVRRHSFAELWQGAPLFKRLRALSLADFPACAACDNRPFCRRSSGAVYCNTGCYTGVDAFTCMEAAVLRECYGAAASHQAAPAVGGLSSQCGG